jgi:hypothetical protein
MKKDVNLNDFMDNPHEARLHYLEQCRLVLYKNFCFKIKTATKQYLELVKEYDKEIDKLCIMIKRKGVKDE